jgi:hypothetical protein
LGTAASSLGALTVDAAQQLLAQVHVVERLVDLVVVRLDDAIGDLDAPGAVGGRGGSGLLAMRE